MIAYDDSIEKMDIKSEKAKMILEQTPSFIIRIGIFSFTLIFVIVMIIFYLIDIYPSIKIEVILNPVNKEKITGYALFPNKEIVSSRSSIPLTFTDGLANVLPECAIIINEGDTYVKNGVVYIAMDIKQIGERKDNLIIQDNLYTSCYINLAERSVFQWIIENMFHANRLVLY